MCKLDATEPDFAAIGCERFNGAYDLVCRAPGLPSDSFAARGPAAICGSFPALLRSSAETRLRAATRCPLPLSRDCWESVSTCGRRCRRARVRTALRTTSCFRAAREPKAVFHPTDARPDARLLWPRAALWLSH